MGKNKLLLFPLIVGIVLLVYSWYLSYPLTINSAGDFVFNHMLIMYWFSLPLILIPMYILAVTCKSNWLKWIISLGIVITIYSLFYFYYMLPGSDAHYFRGLTESFMKTQNLDPTQPYHSYFQWPSFFVLAKVVTSVSGLDLRSFEFLLYTLIGFLLVTTMYVYASKVYIKGGFLAVVAFFIGIYYFLNYQCVPFSLAFSLLFALLMLETRLHDMRVSTTLTMLLLFTSISLTHAFVPMFFILYLLVRCILNRSKEYGRFFLLTLIIYLSIQITQARFSFDMYVRIMMASTEYSDVMAETLRPAFVPIDTLAQMFSRVLTIICILICGIGSTLLLIRKKARDLDKAIFIVGASYSVFGVLFYILGTRAISLTFFPVSLGASYLFESKLKRYLTCCFLILLSLFAFIPLHVSFVHSPALFQTQEAYTTANFMIEKYDWNRYSTILADTGPRSYIFPQVEGNFVIGVDVSSNFQSSDLKNYECIVYSVGLAKVFWSNNISADETSQVIQDKFNVIYNSHLSYVAKSPR